jgi:transposase
MKISSVERIRLETLRKTTKSADEYSRCSVILGLDKGISMETIISVLGISRSSGYDYAKEYEKNSKTIRELPTGKPSHLSNEQTEIVIEHLM